MISFLINAIKIIFLLGFLILIHEAGHFCIAKLFKVKVHEFAIGFGPKVWTKQGKETKYELRLIPLGGFVRLEGEDTKSEDERAFNNACMFLKKGRGFFEPYIEKTGKRWRDVPAGLCGDHQREIMYLQL